MIRDFARAFVFLVLLLLAYADVAQRDEANVPEWSNK
jgi:hypothetical protein